MPNETLNHAFEFFLMIFSVAIPFYFQYRLKKDTAIGPEWVEKFVSKATFALSVILYVSFSLHPASKTNSSFPPSIAVFIFSIGFLYRFKATYQGTAETHSQQLSQSFRRYLVVIALAVFAYGSMQLFSTQLGILPVALFVFVALIYGAPFFSRFILRALPMNESHLKFRMMKTFSHSGETVDSIYLTENAPHSPVNAFLSGTRFGRGPFKRSLFLSENIFTLLTENELNAVIAHEAAHIKQKHLSKNMIFAIVTGSLGILAAAILLSLLSISFHEYSQFPKLAPLIAVVCMCFNFSLLFRLKRKHEHEADLWAVTYFGCAKEDVISAIKKLTIHNGQALYRSEGGSWFGNTHPTFHEREQAILHTEMPKSTNGFIPKKLIYGYFSVLAAISAYTGFYVSAHNQTFLGTREVASEKQSK